MWSFNLAIFFCFRHLICARVSLTMKIEDFLKPKKEKLLWKIQWLVSIYFLFFFFLSFAFQENLFINNSSTEKLSQILIVLSNIIFSFEKGLRFCFAFALLELIMCLLELVMCSLYGRCISFCRAFYHKQNFFFFITYFHPNTKLPGTAIFLFFIFLNLLN